MQDGYHGQAAAGQRGPRGVRPPLRGAGGEPLDQLRIAGLHVAQIECLLCPRPAARTQPRRLRRVLQHLYERTRGGSGVAGRV